MLTQFLFANIHFIVTVFSSLAFFATGWLHIDSWKIDRNKKLLLFRGIGFILLSLVSAIHATTLEVPLLSLGSHIAKLAGLLLILGSLTGEPILKKPQSAKVAVPLIPGLEAAAFISASGAIYLIISYLYFYKATKGLEKQIKPGFWAFLFLGLSQILAVGFAFSNTEIVFWSRILSDHGFLWILTHLLEFIGVVILGIWTWGYLRFRIKPQLFILFLTSTFVIFSATTFLFTYLLLRNIRNDALAHLKIDAKVLQFSIESLQFEALADSRAIAESAAVGKAVLSDEFQKDARLSMITIYSESGQILSSTGEDINAEVLVKKALQGQQVTTIVKKEGVIIPKIQVLAASPIIEREQDLLLGAVVVGFTIDDSFVDGVKAVTGLTATVFGTDVRAATTVVSADGTTRFLGTKEANQEILNTVLVKGEVFVGQTQILNQPYLAAYTPLKGESDQVVGMLSVAQPEMAIINTAQNSYRLTFIGAIILVILTIIPTHFLSKYIKENLEI